MTGSTTLIKSNPLLPAEDYTGLRKAGVQYIEKLGSDIWTEYNESDPGITILEAVCYAITDLAYRTEFEIKDLLMPDPEDPKYADMEKAWENIFYTARKILHNTALTINDYRKLMIDIPGVRNAWLTPSKDYEVPLWVNYNHIERRKEADCSCDDAGDGEICAGKLSISEVTIDVIQKTIEGQIKGNSESIAKQTKILAELNKKKQEIEKLKEDPKVKNDVIAWDNLLLEEASVLRKIKWVTGELAKLAELDKYLKNTRPVPSKILELEGLYNVMVEYEEDVVESNQREDVRQKVVDTLFAQRNICEDFISVNAVEYIDFSIIASLELEEYADADEIVAKMFFEIYKYFTPSVPFHTIDQMQQRGYEVDEIFEGPALKHGFIDDADLEKTSLYRDIHLSDIIREISAIPGLKAITYLRLPDQPDENEDSKNYFNEWVAELRKENKVARIDPSLSKVVCCKKREFTTYNSGEVTDRRPQRMYKLFKDLKTLERSYKLQQHQTDFPVPVGKYMNITDYYPVSESLPAVYGVGHRGAISDGASTQRIAQARQLKGYLLFFEQILSDYLVQLSNIRQLFNFSDDFHHTYFTRCICELEGIRDLYTDLVGKEFDKDKSCRDTFAGIIEEMIGGMMETTASFGPRRNKFLDHMLARFGEDISEYEQLSRWLTPVGVEERMIGDKTRMLQNDEYIAISSERGKGYNYTIPGCWDAPNVSGAERRVARLLGFENINRMSLAPDFIFIEPVMVTKNKAEVQKTNANDKLLNVIRFVDPEDKARIILTSVEVIDGCCTETLIEEILLHADNRQYFVFKDDLKYKSRKAAGLVGAFWFELWDGEDSNTATMLAQSETFNKKEDMEQAFDRLQQLMDMINRNEGLHMVENILLRPKFDEVLDEGQDIEGIELFDICLDNCDLGIGNSQNTDVPAYRTRIHRIPSEKCYDRMPWVLQYIKKSTNKSKETVYTSVLFQQAFSDGKDPLPLKFKRYELLADRVSKLREFGTERSSYTIVPNGEEATDKIKYSFIIHDDKKNVLAQSAFIYDKRNNNHNGIEEAIADLMKYFEYELDLYCEKDACDNNEDPYSFRATVVLPCWPKRLRDNTFRHLVEKTIQTEFPAHVHTRVVWVGIGEMKRFEKAYADWMQEMAITEMPEYDKVNPLVQVLKTLKPCGTCKDEC